MSQTQDKADLYHAVELVYAQALIELAQEAGQIDSVTEQVKQLRDLLIADPDIVRLLSSRVLSMAERQDVAKRAFSGRVSDLVLHFLQVLVRKNRFDEFPGIAAAFLHLVDVRFGTIQIEAFVAAELDTASSYAITSRIAELTHRDVRLRQHIDAELIGGLKIRVADELIDGSVATQLRLVEQRLKEASRETARTRLNQIVHE